MFSIKSEMSKTIFTNVIASLLLPETIFSS